MATANAASMASAHKGVPLIPKLTTKTYTITLPAPLWARLRKPITGQGGWQDLMTALQAHTDQDKAEAEIPEALMHRMIPYAVKFGSGGYQAVIRWVLCLVLEQHEKTLIGEPKTLKAQIAQGVQ